MPIARIGTYLSGSRSLKATIHLTEAVRLASGNDQNGDEFRTHPSHLAMMDG